MPYTGNRVGILQFASQATNSSFQGGRDGGGGLLPRKSCIVEYNTKMGVLSNGWL